VIGGFVYIIRLRQGGAVVSVHWSMQGAIERMRSEASRDHLASERDFSIDTFEVKP
jgi:hypothetical protein